LQNKPITIFLEKKMIRDTIVFVPETEVFTRVESGGDPSGTQQSSLVRVDNSESLSWQRDEDLVPIFEGCGQNAPIADIIGGNIPWVLKKIAGFLWRKIKAVESKREAQEQQIKDLQKQIAQIKNDIWSGHSDVPKMY